MKIYNEMKTEILENPDLKKGYLKDDKLIVNIIPPQEEIAEEWHYEYKEYENGGKDRIKVVDVAYKPAQLEQYEYEDILIYIPYTKKEFAQSRISELKQLLSSQDYKTIKYIQGELSEEEFTNVKAQCKAWRDEINLLEADL